MDAKTVVAIGSLIGLVFGSIITWLLFNERRLSRLETAQENTAATVKEGIQRIDASVKALGERIDAYFTK